MENIALSCVCVHTTIMLLLQNILFHIVNAIATTQIDHCNLRDVKVFLNSTYFPYENLNISFSENKIALLYEQYARFQQSYYGRRPEPLLNLKEFIEKAPLFIIDCSRQNDNVKSGPVVNIRLELESNTEFPDLTAAYCLILNDCLIEYKPLSNIVRKLS